jgi:hypothetical protein
MKIVESTFENRASLHSAFIKLDFGKESALRVCDIAMPAFCKDWARMEDYAKISGLLVHSERRVRNAASKIWLEVVSNTPSARTKMAKDHLLDIFITLCSSANEDSFILGCQTIPYMAIELSKSGLKYTRNIVGYLTHPRIELRKAALHSIQVISNGSDADRFAVLEAGGFDSLKLALQTHPLDDPDTAKKILVNLAPAASTSAEACSALLQLLE